MRGSNFVLALAMSLGTWACDVCWEGYDACNERSKTDWGQVSQEVVAAYEEAFIYPESFDDYVQNNDAIYMNENFVACLNSIANRLLEPALEHSEVCQRHANPDWRFKCENENDARSMRSWALMMASIANGEERYSETISGQAALVAKQGTDAELGVGTYEQIAKESAAALRDVTEFYLNCR